MKSGWWRHRYQQGLLVDVGNILYLILRNIFHFFSMALHSVLLLKQQISFARMVQLWRAGNGILILTSLSEQRPRHDVCGISDRVCGDMQSILHACVRFLSLLNCSQMMKILKIMSSPAPKRFSDTPNPKATHCLLFALFWSTIMSGLSPHLHHSQWIWPSFHPSGRGLLFAASNSKDLDGLVLKEGNAMVILLMVQKSGDHRLGSKKPVVNNGINY